MSLSTYKGIRAGHLAERRKRAPTLTQAELLQAYFQLARTYKLQFFNLLGGADEMFLHFVCVFLYGDTGRCLVCGWGRLYYVICMCYNTRSIRDDSI